MRPTCSRASQARFIYVQDVAKCVMLATPEGEMAGTMSFSSLVDAVPVAIEQWSAQQPAFIV
jgi:hypothetical protein